MIKHKDISIRSFFYHLKKYNLLTLSQILNLNIMRLALAQLNYHIGNFEYNIEKIISSIIKAKQENADLIVFSELSVCGYPPLDLLERQEFIEQTLSAIEQISEYCDTIAAIIGAPVINTNSKGKKLYNSAYFIENKKVKSITNKTLLPSYDIFDEHRYFESNSTFNTIIYKGKNIAITICEDLWEKQPSENKFSKQELYKSSPMEDLSKHKPDIIINIAASPFSYTQKAKREKILKECCKKYHLPLIYVNQTGGNTDLIFDGNSLVINNKGNIVKKLQQFKEDIAFIEYDKINTINVLPDDHKNYIEDIHDALILGIKDYFYKNKLTKATLGLSGGIDSAIVVYLAVKALGHENVRVLLMPSQYSTEHSIKDAVDLAKNLRIQYEIIPIKDIFNSYLDTTKSIFVGKSFDVTEENIQARIRGTLLMGISNKFGNILLNTSNKSEAAVGYGTLYGDMNGALAVIGDVYKTDVFNLAKFINKEGEIIPINTIIKPPSAELRPDQKDMDSLPPYDILDAILKHYIEYNMSEKEIIAKGYDIQTVKKIIQLVKFNEYKRYQTPPTLRISSKAFGSGRRIPLVAKY